MSVTEPDVEVPPVGPPESNGQADEWKRDTREKEYIARGGGKAGIIYRQGQETAEQARARDSVPKEERRPRRRPRTPPKPPAPTKLDLKALEAALAEGLKAPGAICASFGDEWGAEHFVTRGPYLARNLVLAAQHNPWLRQQLEKAASGEDAMMKIVGLLGLGGALVMYIAPPVIYYLNLDVPERSRQMLDLPPRRPDAPAEPTYQTHPADHPAAGPVAA